MKFSANSLCGRAALAIVALGIAGASLSTSAQAQRRPYSPDMNCRAVAEFVALNGAAVIRTGPNTYDRYVSSRAYCTPQEQIKAAWVPAIDTPACFIGYTCEQIISNRR